MTGGAEPFVGRVHRRLGWQAALTRATDVAALGAVPAALATALGLVAGSTGVGTSMVALLVGATLWGAAAGWHMRPRVAAAAVCADRALRLDGLLATLVAPGAVPAGFRAALATRAARAVSDARPAAVAPLRAVLGRRAALALAGLVAVAALALLPVAGAAERARSDAALTTHGAALLALARGAAGAADRQLADAITRAGQTVADTDAGTAAALDAVAGAERRVAAAERRAADARAALGAIAEAEAGPDAAAAAAALERAEAAAPDGAARAAIARARAAPAGSDARTMALDAAVASLGPLAAGDAAIARQEIAAHLRQARQALGGTAEAAAEAAGDTGGSGRTSVDTPAVTAPDPVAQLSGVAPRVLGRPTWPPDDDGVVRRYFAPGAGGVPTEEPR